MALTTIDSKELELLNNMMEKAARLRKGCNDYRWAAEQGGIKRLREDLDAAVEEFQRYKGRASH